jgi:hypothetical protein
MIVFQLRFLNRNSYLNRNLNRNHRNLNVLNYYCNRNQRYNKKMLP